MKNKKINPKTEILTDMKKITVENSRKSRASRPCD